MRSESEIAAMCAENDSLAHYFVRGITKLREGPAYEDALQEARIALLSACRKFDPERKVKFAAYAGFGIQHAIWRWMTQHSRCGFTYLPSFRHGVPVPDYRPLSIDDTHGDGNPVFQPAAEDPDIVGCSEVRERAESLMRTLRARDREVMRMYFWESMTYEQIGDALGVTRARIGQIIERSIREIAAEAQRRGITREVLA